MSILILTPELMAQVPPHLQLSGGRMGCPFHGSTNSRSLVVFPDGGFYCHKCQVKGVTQESHERWKARVPLNKKPTILRSTPLPTLKNTVKDNAPVNETQAQQLARWQAMLPSASQYLSKRAIPLELAKAYGLGFKPTGEPFFLSGKGNPVGLDERVIVPHTNPADQIVSLYGRSIDAGVDKNYRHLHLPVTKGVFNAQALNLSGEPLYVCEGAFDALSLLAMGFKRVIAVFGLRGFRWDWLAPNEQEIVLAFDYDENPSAQEGGKKSIDEFLLRATNHNIRVLRVTKEEMGGYKDINDAWVAGALNFDAPESPALPDYLTIPLDPPEKWMNRKTWSNYRELVRIYSPEQTGYSATELFSMPTGESHFNYGILWAGAGFDEVEIEFLPEIVIFKSKGVQNTMTRQFMRLSGWVSWREM